jgi:putative transposase
MLVRNPLKRYYGRGDLHFITFSCYHRKPLLGTPRAREVVVKTLDEVREQYDFLIAGYVSCPSTCIC